MLKAGTKGLPKCWHGVLRDEKGNVVWTCEHTHRNRDLYCGFLKQEAAIACARAELQRRHPAPVRPTIVPLPIPAPTKKTLQQWCDLVRATTVNMKPEQIIDTAFVCFETDQAGAPVGVWHAASLVCKSRCNCAPCNPTAPKGRFTYKTVAA